MGGKLAIIDVETFQPVKIITDIYLMNNPTRAVTIATTTKIMNALKVPVLVMDVQNVQKV